VDKVEGWLSVGAAAISLVSAILSAFIARSALSKASFNRKDLLAVVRRAFTSRTRHTNSSDE